MVVGLGATNDQFEPFTKKQLQIINKLLRTFVNSTKDETYAPFDDEATISMPIIKSLEFTINEQRHLEMRFSIHEDYVQHDRIN